MYSDIEVQASFNHLRKVVEILEEPICILGGWAIFLTVNARFEKRLKKPYLGSRDIDLGFHLAKKWNKKQLENSSFAKALKALETEGFESTSFRLVKHLDRQTRKTLSKTEYAKKPMFDIIEMYVDLMVDEIPKQFKTTFKMNPVSEQLIKQVFKNRYFSDNYSSSIRNSSYSPFIIIAFSQKV